MGKEDDGADQLVLVLTDEAITQDLPGLRWDVLNCAMAGRRDVLVDVGAVRALSSTAVAVLLNLHRICRARGGGLLLLHPNTATLELLEQTGLNRVLRVVEPLSTSRGHRESSTAR